jgi:hypothetical protein
MCNLRDRRPDVYRLGAWNPAGAVTGASV